MNHWIELLKKLRKENPKLSFKEILKLGKKTYKKSKKHHKKSMKHHKKSMKHHKKSMKHHKKSMKHQKSRGGSMVEEMGMVDEISTPFPAVFFIKTNKKSKG